MKQYLIELSASWLFKRIAEIDIFKDLDYDSNNIVSEFKMEKYLSDIDFSNDCAIVMINYQIFETLLTFKDYKLIQIEGYGKFTQFKFIQNSNNRLSLVGNILLYEGLNDHNQWQQLQIIQRGLNRATQIQADGKLLTVLNGPQLSILQLEDDFQYWTLLQNIQFGQVGLTAELKMSHSKPLFYLYHTKKNGFGKFTTFHQYSDQLKQVSIVKIGKAISSVCFQSENLFGVNELGSFALYHWNKYGRKIISIQNLGYFFPVLYYDERQYLFLVDEKQKNIIQILKRGNQNKFVNFYNLQTNDDIQSLRIKGNGDFLVAVSKQKYFQYRII